MPFKQESFIDILEALFLRWGVIAIFVCVGVCGIPFWGIAQDPGYIYFDTSNGLVSDEVYDIEIDSNGIIWLTTDRGVQSYDGYAFKHYTDSDGLADNVNFEIFKDRNGVMWFNGYNGKISYYENGQFYEFEYNHLVEDYLKTNKIGWISNLVVHEDVITLVGNGNAKIKRLIIEDGEPGYSNDFSTEKKNGETFKYKKVSDYIISSFSRENSSKDYLFSAFGSIKHGRTVVQNANSILVKTIAEERVIQLDSEIEYINNEEERSIWVGTNTGLYHIDLENNFELKKYFDGLLITAIQKDIEGNYWVSTIEAGVLVIPSFDFKNISFDNTVSSNEKFLSIGVLGEYVLTGTSSGFIYAIDSNRQTRLVQKSKYGKEQIQSLNKMDDGRLYTEIGILSYNQGVFEIKESFSRSLQYYYKDYILMCVPTGLKYLDRGQAYTSQYALQEVPVFSKVQVIHIEEDYFLSGSHEGLFLTKGIDFEGTKELTFKGKSLGRVNAIIKDDYDNIIIITMSKGLFLYKPGELTKLLDWRDRQLLNCGAFEDKNLWLGSNEGLVKCNVSYEMEHPRLEVSRQYNITDGLPSNYINDLVFKDNKLWLATNKGVCVFEHKKENLSNYEIPLFIEYVVANDTLPVSNGTVLTYAHNNISIGFKGVSLRKEFIKDFYKYRLTRNGLEGDWKFTNTNELQFEELEGGNYTFEVNVKNYFGVWNKEARRFDFRIKPHFTERLWFRLLTSLLFIGLMYSYMQWQFKRNKTRYQLSERLKQVELDARESELSLLRNQMNPHFIFNSLNSIQNLIFKKEEKKANQFLTSFGKLIRRTLDFTKRTTISLKEEIDFTQTYLDLELLRFPEKFSYVINDQLSKDWMLVNVPPLMLQPIVENCIKHAFKGIKYPGKIEITVADGDNSYFSIFIQDNGVGYLGADKKSDHQSIGLSLIKNRLELINDSLGKEVADLQIANANGTRVHLKLPVTL